MPEKPTLAQLENQVQELQKIIDGYERREKRFKLAFDTANIGIFRIDDRGHIRDANAYACRKLGYSRQELCRMTVPDIDPMFTESFKQHRRKSAGNTAKTIETIHRRKDGSTFPVEITVSHLVFDNERFSVALQRDLTGRKRAEDEIRESERIMKSIFRASPIGIGLVSNRTVVDINDRFCEMTGYRRKELIGKNAQIMYPTKEDYDYVGREKYRQISKFGKGTVETRIQCKDSRIIDVIMSSSPLDPDDLSAGVTFTVLDITARKQAEREKSRIETQYVQAQKVEAIGQLAGGVAHDLNNLLSPIMGFSELLLAETESGDPRRKSLEQILRASAGARDLVQQLLAFSRKQTLEYKALDLNETLSGFEKLLRRTIRENIDFRIVLSSQIGPVRADIGQIEQVIMNLTINAADAMPDGGRLTIETSPAVLDEAYAREHPGVIPGNYVMMAVSDSGHGMDEATCTKIFEPFFSTKGEQGTGLGLSTVYGIVKQHKGSVWVYSEPDRGTTFKIYLPRDRRSEVAAPQSAVSPPTDLTGTETILLVEDNEQVRIIAEEILKRYGYTLLTARNGTEAFELPPSQLAAVQLLLTDVIMPEMNGKELFTRLSAAYPGIKVLYMSGYTSNVIVHQGALDQRVRFIQKPFTARTLAAKVREVLND